MVKTEFDVVFDKGESQLPDAFYQIKLFFLAEVIELRNLENTGNHNTHAPTLIAISRNWTILEFEDLSPRLR